MCNAANQTEALRLHLTWNNPSTGEYYECVNPLPITIGRAASLNAIVLNNKQVSRQHARLERVGTEVILVDQGSTNGTLIDHQPIKYSRLNDGDSFQIPPFIFTIKNIRLNHQTASERSRFENSTKR